MRKSLLFVAKMFLVALFPFVTSCGIDDVDAEDGAIVFELYDDEGSLVEGLQSMKFGETTAYTLKSAFVTYTEVIAPTGWKCSVIPSSRSCTISAPALSDLEAEAGGDITINIQSQSGRTLSYTIKVAALEDDVVLTFDGSATTDRLIYSYGKSLTYTYSSENVASLNVEMPAGWTYENDLDAGTLTVTAPSKEFENPTLIGDVKVTPLSIRSTAGASSTIPVELSTKMPVIEFQQEAYRFKFSEQMDIPCTLSYIDQCNITTPDGWTATLDKENSQLKVTAPAANTGATNGTFLFDATSEDGLTDSFQLDVAIYGISTADEFIAFGEAVTAGTPLDDYTLDNEIILHQNIDLSTSQLMTFVGSAEQPFAGVFNGNGKTINVALSDLEDTKEIGLFHTLGATAAVKNLTIAGQMNIATLNPVVAGVLCAYNAGAALTDITNTADITYTGAKSSSTMGHIGGLVGQATGGSVYTNCQNTGKFTFTQSVRSIAIGGIIGSAANETVGSLVNCSNKGAFTLTLADIGQDSGRIGGLVGMTEVAEWSYTDCTNEGAFTMDFGGTNRQFHSLGGILGYGYGSFTRCTNAGAITMNNALSANRRIGGIAGCIGSDNGNGKLSLTLIDCHNTADFALTTNYVGGLIGIAEKMKAGLIEDCTNTGNLSNPNTNLASDKVPNQFGGIIGCAYGNCTIKNCKNYGNISGLVRYRAAGILSGVRNANNRIENCENHGNLNIQTIEAATTAFPIVAGIVTIENECVMTIRTCTNTGSITATVKSAECVDPVYVYQKAVESGKADQTDCDEASKSNSAGTVINITLKE